MRSPAKIAGSAAGNCSLRRRVQRLAPFSVNRSCCTAVGDFSPKSVLATMGKIEMMAQIMIRLLLEKPIFRPTSGAIATSGTVCRMTA